LANLRGQRRGIVCASLAQALEVVTSASHRKLGVRQLFLQSIAQNARLFLLGSEGLDFGGASPRRTVLAKRAFFSHLQASFLFDVS
jgi:hypothetical protein